MESTNATKAASLAIGIAMSVTSAIASPLPTQTINRIMRQANYSSTPNAGADVYPYINPLVLSGQHPSPTSMFINFDLPEVVAFLEKNPEISPILEDTFYNINKYFPGSPIEMSVSIDPDTDNYEHLTLAIQVDIEPEQAFVKLHDLWDNWMFTELSGVRDKMIIDVEFV